MPELQADRRSSFAALRYRDFRLLWAGQLISITGTQMQMLAINWHVYLLTKSALALGLVGLVRVVPIVVCSLLGGAVADAVNRKRLMMLTQTVMLLCAAALALMTWYGLTSVWPIYVLTAVAAAALAFDNPARQAFLPSLVPAEDFPNAVSLNVIIFQIGMIAGPSLAGILIGEFGPAAAYAGNAASFLAVVIALVLIRAPGKAGDGTAPVSIESVREGLRFVRSTPIIVQTMLLDFVATFFASATTLLPIFAVEVLHVGARGLGILASAPAVGSVISGFVMARLGNINRQGATVIVAVATYGLATIGFGLSRSLWLSLVMLSLVGASDTVSTVLRQTIRQLVTPDGLRGRITSVNMIFFMGGPQLGELEAGLVAAAIGAPWSVVAGGACCLIAAGWAWSRARSLRAYQR
jgi:MFS family permease